MESHEVLSFLHLIYADCVHFIILECINQVSEIWYTVFARYCKFEQVSLIILYVLHRPNAKCFLFDVARLFGMKDHHQLIKGLARKNIDNSHNDKEMSKPVVVLSPCHHICCGLVFSCHTSLRVIYGHRYNVHEANDICGIGRKHTWGATHIHVSVKVVEIVNWKTKEILDFLESEKYVRSGSCCKSCNTLYL